LEGRAVIPIGTVNRFGSEFIAPPTSENYRFFAAFFATFFFTTFFFAAFFAILFSSGYLVSASTDRLTRHNWWAESSTLIPDVDYG
jgi:hypothetical protein